MFDGDDLVYPTFLSQISKAFDYENNLNMNYDLYLVYH